MEFHEKSLELNITHELLNLADSWCWFLTKTSLWKYWTPGYRLPFMNFPKSTAGGLHTTTEGGNDSTGNAGGGYDVRIQAGLGRHLLFIQYKKGKLVLTSPRSSKSEFKKPPHEHFKFKINSTRTNQHFILRKLEKGIGSKNANAVVYAFPLIANMEELEANTGKLIRKTKFVSIADIDKQALLNNVSFTRNKEHNFRIGKFDMNRCEVNYFYYFFYGKDKTAEIISDIIAIGFQKNLSYFLNEIKTNNLFEIYTPLNVEIPFIQYTKYLLHYFEVSPFGLKGSYIKKYEKYFSEDEFNKYDNNQRDKEIVSAIFKSLNGFYSFFEKYNFNLQEMSDQKIPDYPPKIWFSCKDDVIKVKFNEGSNKNVIEDISYLAI